jgi:hypothetical protein
MCDAENIVISPMALARPAASISTKRDDLEFKWKTVAHVGRL